MPCTDPDSRFWFRVPRNSRFELTVNGTDDNFAAFAYFSADGNPPDQWNKHEISPGPKTATIIAPHTYNCWVSIAFLGQQPTTVQVAAQIIQPDGQPFEAPYCHEATGRMGDNAHITLKIYGKVE
jgi:hypothetical protein